MEEINLKQYTSINVYVKHFLSITMLALGLMGGTTVGIAAPDCTSDPLCTCVNGTC